MFLDKKTLKITAKMGLKVSCNITTRSFVQSHSCILKSSLQKLLYLYFYTDAASIINHGEGTLWPLCSV